MGPGRSARRMCTKQWSMILSYRSHSQPAGDSFFKGHVGRSCLPCYCIWSASVGTPHGKKRAVCHTPWEVVVSWRENASSYQCRAAAECNKEQDGITCRRNPQPSRGSCWNTVMLLHNGLRARGHKKSSLGFERRQKKRLAVQPS